MAAAHVEGARSSLYGKDWGMADNSIRLLMAEDDPDHQHVLTHALTRGREGVHVTVVDTGGKLLEALEANRYDCVVLDFNLPDYRADKLLVRARPLLRKCPALVVSSSQSQEVVIETIRHGGVDFVPKQSAMRGDCLWERVTLAIQRHAQSLQDQRRYQRRARKLERLAETDHLTQLGNRRHLHHYLDDDRWREDRRLDVTCVMLDIDDFKHVNDEHGHAAGDAVLKALARNIRDAIDVEDVAVRWGGEEFLIIRSGSDLLSAWLWAEQLRAKISAITVSANDGTPLSVRVSAGLAHEQRDAFSEATINSADEALYLAKARGRNQVCTTAMIAAAAAMEAEGKDASAGSEQRLRGFIRRMMPHLGRTQAQHLTMHSRLVCEIAVALSRLLGDDAQTTESVRIAAMAHDVGKCVIPEELLAKPVSLRIEERRLIDLHQVYGQWIAAGLNLGQDIERFVRHHHTRYDSRISQADELPVGARVLCVADALATMLTDRSYRPARTLGGALYELHQERGGQFDPRIVDCGHSIEPERLGKAA